MEKYPPSLSRRHSSSARPVPAKLRERAERSVARRQSQQEAARRKQEAERHETVARLTAIWKNEIIPNWPDVEHSTRVIQ